MKRVLMLMTGLLAISCTQKSATNNPLLVEANKVHLEAEAIQEQIEPEIETIDSLKNLLQSKKVLKADSLANELSTLKADFENWEKIFFAVPGFEHEHEGKHEHHHHDHAPVPVPELPADKMLEVQREIKRNIEQIRTRLSQLSEQSREVLK